MITSGRHDCSIRCLPDKVWYPLVSYSSATPEPTVGFLSSDRTAEAVALHLRDRRFRFWLGRPPYCGQVFSPRLVIEAGLPSGGERHANAVLGLGGVIRKVGSKR